MAGPLVTAGQIMDTAAVLYNDAAKQVVTYAVQIPFLNIAMDELKEYFELNNIPVTDTTTTDPIDVLAGVSEVGFAPEPAIPSTPYLPDDLIEPKVVWERQLDNNPYVPMTRVDFLPRYMEGAEIPQLVYFQWASQQLKFMAANGDNQIKIDYIRNIFAPVTEEDDEITVVNVTTFLEFRLAGLLSEFIGENQTRAASQNNSAALALDRSLGIGTKGRQAITIRRQPFRSSYKRRIFM